LTVPVLFHFHADGRASSRKRAKGCRFVQFANFTPNDSMTAEHCRLFIVLLFGTTFAAITNQQIVVALPKGPRLPKFPAQKFSSHREMNEWKKSLLRELARSYPNNGRAVEEVL